MIKSTGLLKVANYIDSLVVKADYTINNVTYPAEIRKSIVQGTKVIKRVYLTTVDPIGTVTRVRLFDKDGDVFAENATPKVHEKNKGRLFQFEFSVNEVTS